MFPVMLVIAGQNQTRDDGCRVHTHDAGRYVSRLPKDWLLGDAAILTP